MSCDYFGDYNPCDVEAKAKEKLLKKASDAAGLDLSVPQDMSEMTIREVSTETVCTESARMEFLCKVVLHAYIVAEQDDNEEITITIIRKSPRIPKL